MFYVEMSFSSVEALRAVNKRVTMPNGFKVLQMCVVHVLCMSHCRIIRYISTSCFFMIQTIPVIAYKVIFGFVYSFTYSFSSLLPAAVVTIVMTCIFCR